MENRTNRAAKVALGKLAGALALVGLLLVLACGGDSTTAAPQPTATTAPTIAPTEASDKMESSDQMEGSDAMAPSMDQLGGGHPAVFTKVFADGLASSQFRPTSEFAAAAQPLEAGEKLKIGFIFVGSRKDLGYNQAASEGSQYLEQAIPNVEVIRAENIPETAEVQAVAEQMIQDGAKIIFPTSFGYSGPIKQIIDKHPDVMFLHMGDVESFENYGAFFGNIWQLEFAAGKAAGHASETGKLGFIAAFPIPQTLQNVNAFHLGAKSINPEVKTTFVLTNAWCDPAKQATAVRTMIEAGVDVITQHQDCTKTIVEAAERAGIFVTGYHQDASAAAPNAWLTGAVWNWGPVYTEIVTEIMNGTYKSSIMFAGLEAGWVKLSPFGSSVDADVRQLVLDTVEGLREGEINPFAGPVSDQDGTVRIQAGESPSNEELQQIDWLAEGITGRTS